MRYVELFAGAGGLSMGLEAAGMHPVAHAEIEPHARTVLRRQWPDTPLHGDVTQVDWTQYAGQVDLVAGGSPCQDLSVAGKRAGLAGARSGLFFELIRAWDETGAPYCLWENVDGARSSNKGEDFAAVLSAFVGAPVAVPRDGWRGAGVAAGATGVAAWRVLDLQHFGPPQRRRRIFVVAARTGGADPAEILLEPSGVCGHPSPREQSRQGVARGAVGGAAFSVNNDSRAECVTEGVAPLRSGQRQQQSILAFDTTQTPITFTERGRGDALSVEARRDGTVNCIRSPNGGRGGIGSTDAVLALDGTDTVGSLLARADSSPCVDRGQPAVLAFKAGQSEAAGGAFVTEGLSPTLQGSSNGSTQVPAVLAFQNTGHGWWNEGETAQTLRTTDANVICTTGDVAHALTRQPGATEDGTGRGTPIVADAVARLQVCDSVTVGANQTTGLASPNVVAYGRSSFGAWESDAVTAPVCSRDAKDASSLVLSSGQANSEIMRDAVPTLTALHEAPIVTTIAPGAHASAPGTNGQDAPMIQAALMAAGAGRPRRLTPLECERLMGWPDRHTAQGVKEDGTVYALSDTARYRLCGNGVGTPVAAWIATRMVAAVEGLCPP